MSIETWKFINTFAPWLSAIGTLAAVIVSLYLSRMQKRIDLKVNADIIMLIVQGIHENPEYLMISATNVGHRSAKITKLVWEMGLMKKKYFLQTIQQNIYTSELPIKLEDGDEAQWLISLEQSKWIEDFVRNQLSSWPKWNLFWLKLQIHTSLGKTFRAKIGKSLHEALLKEFHKQHT